MSGAGIAVAVVGLGFGKDFLPIYQDHPDVGCVGVVDPDADHRDAVAAEHGIDHRYARLEEVLDEDRWDAVHVLSPVRFHVDHAIAVLDAGKHCACAVPMATDLDAIGAIIAAQRRSDAGYMMMETSAYTREIRAVRGLLERGELGELTYYEGFHIQNLDGFPAYWQGYPPMQYATHALSPALALTGSAVTAVRALGSGNLNEEQRSGGFDNRFPTEVGTFTLDASDAVAQITMSFFAVARTYVEGFNAYGDRMSVTWPQHEDGALRGFRAQPVAPGQRGRTFEETTVDGDDGHELLPPSLRRYTTAYEFAPADGGATRQRPAEHGGSHPHLVHEFVSSIVEGRPAAIDATVAARWTAPGIVAHDSAMADGRVMEVPTYG